MAPAAHRGRLVVEGDAMEMNLEADLILGVEESARQPAEDLIEQTTALARSRSLYSGNDGVPLLRDSFALYLDELGAKERIAVLTDNDLNEWIYLRDRFSDFLDDGDLKDRQRMLAFSDNIIVGAPLDLSQEDGGLFQLIWGLAAYQANMALHGRWVRGAITHGPLYMDDSVVTGQALVDADAIEKKTAIFPRVVLGQDCFSFLISDYKSEADPFTSTVNGYLLIDDRDKKFFINYLSALLEDEPWHVGSDVEALDRHREAVEAGFIANSKNFKVRNKMLWLVDYHNYFCDAGGFSPSLKISTNVVPRRRGRSFSPPVSRLTADEWIRLRQRQEAKEFTQRKQRVINTLSINRNFVTPHKF